MSGEKSDNTPQHILLPECTSCTYTNCEEMPQLAVEWFKLLLQTLL